jgi:hypothetical protein
VGIIYGNNFRILEFLKSQGRSVGESDVSLLSPRGVCGAVAIEGVVPLGW